jgi:hypothetical protein
MANSSRLSMREYKRLESVGTLTEAGHALTLRGHPVRCVQESLLGHPVHLARCVRVFTNLAKDSTVSHALLGVQEGP